MIIAEKTTRPGRRCRSTFRGMAKAGEGTPGKFSLMPNHDVVEYSQHVAMNELREESPRRVVVFRALKLGDMLCATPALRALRDGLPNAEIILVGLPWARAFVDRHRGLLDGFREFPGWPGLPERAPDCDAIPGFLSAIRAERFDLAIQLHGSGGTSNAIVSQFGARRTAGFYEAGAGCLDKKYFLPYPSHDLELRRLLSLMEHLGFPSRGEALEFPLRIDDRREALGLLAARGLDRTDFACVHGGASVPERRWPVERFAQAADALADRGLAVVLTGSAGEAEITATIRRNMRNPAVDLAGATPLGTLGALIERSSLLLCNDTGVSHIADALKTPSVVISTGENPARWAPPDGRLHRVLCRESGVTAGEVVKQINMILDEQVGSPRRGPVVANARVALRANL